MLKKTTSILLALIIALSVFAVVPFPASAAEDDLLQTGTNYDNVLTIKSISSDVFYSDTKSYSSDSESGIPETITVSYYADVDEAVYLESAQFDVSWDPEYLSFDPEKNGDYDEDSEEYNYERMIPVAEGSDDNVFKYAGVYEDNRIRFLVSYWRGIPLEKDGKLLPIATVTFDVNADARGKTDVNASAATLAFVNPETWDEYIVYNGKGFHQEACDYVTGGDPSAICSVIEPEGIEIVEEPTTEEPTTVEPTTEEIPTEEPTTEEPPTEEPPTEVTPTEEPPTAEPTTAEPTTEEPTTEEPTTAEPTTEEPTTEEPTTEEPTTEEPTTVEPTTEQLTEEPTTKEPGYNDALTINSKSNVFSTDIKTYSCDSAAGIPDTITVTYYANPKDLNKYLQSLQFNVKYDPEVLSIDEEKNGLAPVEDPDTNTSFYCSTQMMPAAGWNGTIFLESDHVSLNCTGSKGFKLRDTNGGLIPIASIIFDVADGAKGSTDVLADVKALSFQNGTGTDGVDYIVYDSDGLDTNVYDELFGNGGAIYSVIEPDNEESTTEKPTEEPTIEAPTIEVPTIEAPTIEAPTIEVPTIEAPTIEAPTIEAPTIAEPTTEEPTTAEPTTEAPPTIEETPTEKPYVPSGDPFTVNATANAFFSNTTVTYNNGVPDTVTVYYYADVNTDKRLMAAQIDVTYDKDVLSIDPAKNGGYDDDENLPGTMPVTKGTGCTTNTSTAGRVGFVASNYKGYELRDSSGNLIPVIKIVFDVADGANGTTDIAADLQALHFQNGNGDDGEIFTVYNKSSGFVQDVYDAITSEGGDPHIEIAFDDYVPASEPATEDPTEAQPTTEEPTEAEHVYPEIKVGETKMVTIEKGDDIAYFKFVPEQDMMIDFTSLSLTSYTTGYLYDADMKQLAYDNDSGSGHNFKIIYKVTAGTTYYFGAKYYTKYSTGSFDVQLKKYPEIKVGETAKATIEWGSETACFEFVPEQDMFIDFTSLSDKDTEGYLYDADMKSLAYNNDNGSGSNFKINYYVTAGTTYYFGAKYRGSSSTGSFDVQLQEHVYPEIKVGETATATIEKGGDIDYFRFVPEQDMLINFTSLSDSDTVGYLYDSDMKRLAYNFNSGLGGNFKIVYKVTADTTYYFGARYRGNSSTGSFDVQLQKYPEIKLGETATATINKGGNIDYFEFVPEQDMRIVFTSLSDDDTQGYLYDADMKLLAYNDNSISGSNFKIIYEVTAGTTYYFGARYADSSSTGSFDVQLQKHEYPEIKVGETATATIEKSGDIAYLKFVPEQDMSIEFTSLSDDDTKGYLYDADMKRLAFDDNSGSGSNFKIVYRVTVGTTYYFGARYEDSSSTGSFDVQLKKYPEIKVGETATATIEEVGETAYFEFVPEQDMRIVFTSLSDSDTYVNLYDADMKYLAYNDNGGSGSNFKIIYEVTAGTIYYFGVNCRNSFTGSFDVQLQEHVYPEIKVGETATVTIKEGGEIAYFKFVPEQDMWIDFSAMSDSNTYGYLYDADMKTLKSAFGGYNYFRIIYKVTAGTTYYFGAKYYSKYDTGSFDVQLKKFPEIKVGETATATIDKDGETAYFKFVPEQDMMIDFTSLSDDYTCGYLYDADLNQLASDDNGSSRNFRIIYKVTAGTTYYFGAKYKYSSSTDSFDVRLKKVPEIKVGETSAATIDNGGNIAYFKFVPEQDMRIVFTSLSSSDTYGYLYDADMNQLAFDDNSGSGSNFNIIYEVTAGTTYYFGAKYESNSSTGSFDVQLQEHVYPEIKVGETKTVTLEGGDIAYFKFVPEQDMWIYFTSPSDESIYGYLYDADMEELTDGFLRDYSKIIYHVTAGTTYYFGAKFNSYYSTGSFDVQLRDLVRSEIEVGETKTVRNTRSDEIAYFKFVCNKDMLIEFSAGEISSLDDWNDDPYTNGCLYDANLEEITSDLDKEFRVVYSVAAGQTYYLSASVGNWFDGGFDTGKGTFDVTLKEVELWEHNGSEITRYNGYDENVTIPSELDGVAVTSIGEFAFNKCKSIKSVTIPDSVTSIGKSAFNECESLESVTIPDSVTSIGESAFNECESLESVTIPDSITSVGANAFYGTPWESSLPDGLAYVGKAAYKMIGDCPEEVVIKDGTSSITEYAFGNCSGLTSVTIPDSITSIGDSVFYDCTSLESVTIPDSVTSIGEQAFYGCTSLESVTIPNSVESIGDDAFGYYFDDDEWYTSKVDGFTIYGYKGSAAENYANHNDFNFVRIYDTEGETGDCRWSVDGTVLTIYGNGKMSDYDWRGAPWSPDITEVIIEDGVTNIGECAFEDCHSLESVTIGNSVTHIGDRAFYECESLESVTIPDSVTNIGDLAFYGCTGLTGVYISDIGAWCNIDFDRTASNPLHYAHDLYLNNELVTNLIIPDSVTSIGFYAFSDCTKLTSITIPDSVTSIGSSAFSDTAWFNNQPDGLVYAGKFAYRMKGECPAEVIIKDGTLGIADDAFEGCTELTSVTIPNSVTSIAGGAFYGCTGLTSVTIPNSVTSIASGAFTGCTSLKNITVPASVTSIGDIAIGWKRYTSGFVTIGGVTIYGYAGTAAETYANNNDITFIALSDKADSDTGITASVTADVTLDVKDITGTDAVGNIRLNGETILKAYDITLTKDGAAVQPEHTVTVKIPCTNPDAKVYRVEADGSLTDMHAVYENGYLVFTTDHFSVYIVSVPAEPVETLIGDVNGDNSIDVLDATVIQKYAVDKVTLTNEQKYAADVNYDGVVDILDATLIQKYAVDKITEFKKKA